MADVHAGLVLATVGVAAPPERVFEALASHEIVDWWVRPGVFDTREWTGDVRPGGAWEATGIGRGKPYALAGEFVDVDPPRRLVHTWRLVGATGGVTTVTYLLQPIDTGTRLTLRHTGFTAAAGCIDTAIGWETSFQRLAELLADQKG